MEILQDLDTTFEVYIVVSLPLFFSFFVCREFLMC